MPLRIRSSSERARSPPPRFAVPPPPLLPPPGGGKLLPHRPRADAFALGALAGELAGAADSFRLLARALFRGLLVVHVALHLAERAFALHLLLQRFKRLIDVIVANKNLDDDPVLQ